MTTKQRENLTQQLHARHALLARHFHRLRERVAVGRPDVGDPVDVALDEIDRGTDQLLMELEERELAQVVDAEWQLSRGRLGVCRRCGGEIDPRRLVARPESVLCVECAGELEHTRTLH